jgi:uncharacterized protein (DUF1330 family)
MSVYFVATYDIADRQAYEPYPGQVRPLLQKHGAEILVSDFDTTPLEGTPPRVTVIVRFATEAQARAFYDDPEYTAVKQLRLDTTANGRAVLVKGFVPPAS